MDFLRFLFNPIRRLWSLQMGYEAGPFILETGTLSYTCAEGQCIYAFVSLSAANTITTATAVGGATVLASEVPPQGYEVKIRLTSITFSAITGSVLVYVKNISDDAS